MTSIKRTVGRVVWFYSYTPNVGHKGPLAGHVCAVPSDRYVNLMIITENGQPLAKGTVPLIQHGEEVPQADYCTWMPYQIGEAARTAAMPKQLGNSPA